MNSDASTRLRDILVCPETRQSLEAGSAGLVQKLRKAALSGELKNRSGGSPPVEMDGVMCRADGKVVYPVIRGVPLLLIDQAIRLDG